MAWSKIKSAAVTGAAIILVGGITVIVVTRSRPSESSASAEPSPTRSLETASPKAPAIQTPEASGQVQDLQGRLAGERRARQQAEAEAAALREKLASLQTNVVVSHGTVEDMGKRAGTLLPALGELQALTGRDPTTLSPDERRRLLELQRDHAQLLGALPEITRFQDNPDEYGRFFRSMLQQAAGLSDEQATQVEAYMRQRATLMNQLELNAGKEPNDPKLEEVWEEHRDKFNEQTADGLRAILPPGAADKAGLGPELMEFLEMDFDKVNPSGKGAR